MPVKKIVCLSIVLGAAALLCISCGRRQQYGKFSEEQMQQIGLARKYDLPAPTGDTMVLGVHSETISSDDILSTIEKGLEAAAARMNKADFDAEARPVIRNVIRDQIVGVLLYERARKNAPESIDDMLEKAVEDQVNRFVASYGNDYVLAEKKFKEMGWATDWRSFRENQKKLIMTESYLSSQRKEKQRFSHRQLRDYYEQNKAEVFCKTGQVGFSIIAIEPDKLTSEQIAGDSSAQAAAKRIAADLMKQLNTGADFAERAKQYHGDLASVGGKVLPVEPGANALPEPYNTLEARAVEMQPDAIDGPIEIDGRLYILKLDTLLTADCKSFEEVQPLIEQHLLYQYNQQQYLELVSRLVASTDIAQMEQFTDFCVNQAYKRWGRSSS
jgi:hypothetical protein